jgi:hypothetical protein
MLTACLSRYQSSSLGMCRQTCDPAGGKCVEHIKTFERQVRYLCIMGCNGDGDCPAGMRCSCGDMRVCSAFFVVEQGPSLPNNVCIEKYPYGM